MNFFDNYKEKIPNKYQALLSCTSSNVFEYIQGRTDFDTAILNLDDLFVKTPNEIFTEHLLAMRWQKLEEFFRELEKLKKNCNFKDHTAEKGGNEAMQDAFITGVSSHLI